MNSNPKSDYARFTLFLENVCGILLGDNKEYLVNSRLKNLLAKYELENLGQLVDKLERSPPPSLREMVVDAMTTNETLWFRDSHPFQILQDVVYNEFAEGSRSASPLRIWSAACSTGQEPYSICMVTDEYSRKKPGKLRAGIKITATDISNSVLDVAKQGKYDALSLGRGLSDERKQRYFKENPDHSWSVDSKFKSLIDFKTLNLKEDFNRLGGKFDIILCRNVLIYFSPELKADIVSRMHKMLNPGGYLMLGATESMRGLSDSFEMVNCRPGILYKALP